ncbi:hypothetical protein ScalyP_jg4878 [Parmales sp. scaly parma]|nr:hypothetical protein ScalyP_jg4878 [Parmales sp. scaly parma]
MATLSLSSFDAETMIDSFTKVVSNIQLDIENLETLTSINNSLQNENQAPNTVNKLNDLEMCVSSLEAKASMLNRVLLEETSAAADLEKTRDSALKQRALLVHMMDNLPARLPATTATATSSTLPTPQPASTNSVSLQLVTDNELQTVPRSIRSRLTLSALNDAVVQILSVAETKYDLLQQTGVKTRKTKKYQKVVIQHRETEVEEHGGRIWVGEQDLRDFCPFFRSGESSARTILSVLRTLKRLKQIQGAKNTVTYVFL